MSQISRWIAPLLGLVVALTVLLPVATSTATASLVSMGNPVGCINEMFNVTVADKLCTIAMEGLEQKYPYNMAHSMNSEADVKAHYILYPSFHGCYDWHSAVHTTWQLVRLMRTYPNASYVPLGRQVLARLLTEENLLAEAEYLKEEGRAGFERPYGLAWLLQLVAELEEWNDQQGNLWRSYLKPAEAQAVASLSAWLPKLTNPIRIGEHSQTAFSLGLVLDYARGVRNANLEQLVVERSLFFHSNDKDCPLHYEPSGHDFLSPCLGAADLMRRVMTPAQFSEWLQSYLPGMPTDPDTADKWLQPVVSSDPSDGKLAHFDGLNLSRAWMLEGIQSALDSSDLRKEALTPVIESHRVAGMKVVLGDMDYMGSHWLGSFAVYLSTCRGIY